MSALARLTFYENLLIGQEIGVGIKRVQFRENARAFSRTKKTVLNKEVPVYVKRGSTVLLS